SSLLSPSAALDAGGSSGCRPFRRGVRGWAAYWVKNIGFTWYFVPGASPIAIVAVQPQMAALAFGRAAQRLAEQPLLLAIGAVAGTLMGLLLHLPLRAGVLSTLSTSFSADSEPAIQAPQSAGVLARLITAGFMAALAAAVGSLNLPFAAVVLAAITGP